MANHQRPPGPDNLFPPQDVCNELVDLYFDIIHDKDHMLFHRPTFVSAHRKGMVDMTHIAAMMALAARFSSNPWFQDSNRWTRGSVWANYSKHLFDNRKDKVSLAAIQSCVLLSTIAFCDVDMEMESLYGAQAIRMVQLKALPDQRGESLVQRETEIRVWWTVWMLDRWASAEARIPKQLVADSRFPVPMTEQLFEQMSADWCDLNQTSPLERLQLEHRGFWAHLIPVTELIEPINELHEMTVQGRLTDLELYDHVESIASKLTSWRLHLPESLEFTPENLLRYANTGHGRILAALHSGFHHQSQLLYYQFLQPSIATNAESSTRVLEYASRCRQHATDITNLFWLARQTPRCKAMWPMVGHLLAVSSSVHLHSLLFSEDAGRVSSVKHMLKQNFEMMMELRQYWPSIDLSMSRLRSFHQACQRSMNTSFIMDHWMLQFLQQYTKPVQGRDIFHLYSGSSEPIQTSPAWMSSVGVEQGYIVDDSIAHSQVGLEVGTTILQTFL
ncbi:hypothetical protein PV08_04220 [Exophiala spinifera]|uniref:Xylanolytic transcriptional activator regulatory domain-containing protein n=1 Tax=Exophiala spinifera TaxID=91928 RepID=A0A0D2C0C1_9EURO|nr:uncharacterized protein PV08_04220 [Exophiala spinifera]KIW17029.1 hypothetical protein PV08_04220 [Exophiala spinifera]